MGRPRNPKTPQPKVSEQDSDLGELWWSCDKYGYSFRGFLSPEGKRIKKKIHRIVLSRMIGRDLIKREVCDHINGDTLDNRRENLRVVTQKQNCQNQHHEDGLRGVFFCKRLNKWLARVNHEKRHYHCGCFHSSEEAALASAKKRKELGFLTQST
jgi:hypothetical protein